jgi:hypothetical protein
VVALHAERHVVFADEHEVALVVERLVELVRLARAVGEGGHAGYAVVECRLSSAQDEDIDGKVKDMWDVSSAGASVLSVLTHIHTYTHMYGLWCRT